MWAVRKLLRDLDRDKVCVVECCVVLCVVFVYAALTTIAPHHTKTQHTHATLHATHYILNTLNTQQHTPHTTHSILNTQRTTRPTHNALHKQHTPQTIHSTLNTRHLTHNTLNTPHATHNTQHQNREQRRKAARVAGKSVKKQNLKVCFVSFVLCCVVCVASVV